MNVFFSYAHRLTLRISPSRMLNETLTPIIMTPQVTPKLVLTPMHGIG